jgi:hypothetical protein
MTTLERRVYRLTRGAYSTLTAQRRQIVVGLEPGDLVSFREKGRRRRFFLTLSGLFSLAVRKTVEAERRAAKAARANGGGR